MNQKLSSKERIILALNKKKPDRVPIGELVIDNKIIKGINEKYKDVIDLAIGEGLDLVGTVAKFNKVKDLNDGKYIDEWGVVYKRSNDIFDHPVLGPIIDEQTLKDFKFPDPNVPHRLRDLKKFVKKARGRIAVNFHTRVAFMWSAYLMGMDKLMMAMILKPKFAHSVLERVAEVNIKVIQKAIQCGADTISLGDDYCGNSGPLISPELFKEFIFPYLKETVSVIHKEGALCIKHTDGNVLPILDQIIGTGVDCINPIDPLAGMKIGEVKQKYGNEICMMGNIDCTYTLCEGKIEEVEESVKNCIRDGAEGGGLVVASSNSIHSGVNPKNYSAMIKSVHKYGKYF